MHRLCNDKHITCDRGVVYDQRRTLYGAQAMQAQLPEDERKDIVYVCHVLEGHPACPLLALQFAE